MFTKAIISLFVLLTATYAARTDLSHQSQVSVRTFTQWGYTVNTAGVVIITFRYRAGPITLRSDDPVDDLHPNLVTLLTTCTGTVEQLCHIIELIRRRRRTIGNIPEGDWLRMNNMVTWADAVEANKAELSAREGLRRAEEARVQASRVSARGYAERKYREATFSNDCTWNYRKCVDEAWKGVAHQRHHCYWATTRCLQDINTANEANGITCAALFLYAQNILLRVGL